VPTGPSGDGRLDNMLGNEGVKAMESGMLCGYATDARRPARYIQHYDGILMLPLERLPFQKEVMRHFGNFLHS
jgi:hypothetical protein